MATNSDNFFFKYIIQNLTGTTEHHIINSKNLNGISLLYSWVALQFGWIVHSWKKYAVEQKKFGQTFLGKYFRHQILKHIANRQYKRSNVMLLYLKDKALKCSSVRNWS